MKAIEDVNVTNCVWDEEENDILPAAHLDCRPGDGRIWTGKLSASKIELYKSVEIGVLGVRRLREDTSEWVGMTCANKIAYQGKDDLAPYFNTADGFKDTRIMNKPDFGRKTRVT